MISCRASRQEDVSTDKSAEGCPAGIKNNERDIYRPDCPRTAGCIRGGGREAGSCSGAGTMGYRGPRGAGYGRMGSTWERSVSMTWTSFGALAGSRNLLPGKPAGGFLDGQVSRGVSGSDPLLRNRSRLGFGNWVLIKMAKKQKVWMGRRRLN